MENLIIILLIAGIIGGAAAYLLRRKKRGSGCVGCPCAGNCSGRCADHPRSEKYK